MGVYLGSKAVSVYNGGQMAPEEKTVTAGTSLIEVNATSGKLMSKVTVNPTPTEEKTVTPTTEDLVVAPVEGKQLSQVTVQGDANFLEENIAEGVTMWGKTGTHQDNSGAYIWSKQYTSNSRTLDTNGGTYTLTTSNATKPSTEIEYVEIMSDWKQSNVGDGSGSFNTIYYANSMWIACSNFGKGLYYSIDGKIWNQSNITNGTFKCVYYSNKIWIAGGHGIYYSTDGKTWTQSNITSTNIESIYYGNSLWVAGSNNFSSGTGLYYSTDGKTWTQSNITNGDFWKVYYANSIWVACSRQNGLYYSTDGKTWTQSNITNRYIRYIYYFNGVWMACDYGTDSSPGTDGNGIYYSTDGKAWTQSNINSGVFTYIRYSIGILIAISSSNGLYYSTDGKTWTQSNITNGTFNCLCYGNNVWVINTYNGELYCSIDGKIWTKSNIIGESFYNMLYVNGLWVAGSYRNKGIYYATDSIFYNTLAKKWEMDNSTVITLVNTDDILPDISTNIYVRITSEPNVWYLVSDFSKSSSNPYLKSMTYTKKYTAKLKDPQFNNPDYVVSNSRDTYPNGGWDNGYYYKYEKALFGHTVTLIPNTTNNNKYSVNYLAVSSNGGITFSQINPYADRNYTINNVINNTDLIFSSNVTNITDKNGKLLTYTKFPYSASSNSRDTEIYITVNTSL